ncbi:MAG: hypothetical protein U1F00_22445 [Rhodoferax sp.]
MPVLRIVVAETLEARQQLPHIARHSARACCSLAAVLVAGAGRPLRPTGEQGGRRRDRAPTFERADRQLNGAADNPQARFLDNVLQVRTPTVLMPSTLAQATPTHRRHGRPRSRRPRRCPTERLLADTADHARNSIPVHRSGAGLARPRTEGRAHGAGHGGCCMR